MSLHISDYNQVISKLVKNNVKVVNYDVKSRDILQITLDNNDKLNFIIKSAPPLIYQTCSDNLPIAKICYQNEEFVAFEQPSKNFKVRSAKFDLNHIKIALEALVDLHAATFKFEENGKKLNESLDLQHFKLNISNVNIIKIVSSLLNTKTENIDVITRLQHVQNSNDFRRVLCHGNLTAENIFFDYDEKQQTPKNCKFINLETKLYAPPIFDVLQLIFFNSDEHLRKCHFHDLLLHYYSCLTKKLKLQNIQIQSILSTKSWQMQCHLYLPIIKLETVLLKNETLESLKEDLNCPTLSREDCYQIVKKKLKTQSYVINNFKVFPLDEISGFLGDYHKMQITVNNKNINCFVKSMPKNNAPKEVVQDGNNFFKELFIYETLVPKFEECGLDIINDCLPRCYFQREGDLMVFEDLTFKNFNTLSAQQSYDLQTLCMIAKKVARFHASSLIYEEKQSQRSSKGRYRINEEYDVFDEPLIVDSENHGGGKLMGTGVKAIFFALDLFPELRTDQNVKNVKKYWKTFRSLFYSTLKASTKFRNVVNHGDLWSSNILIKSEENENVDCRFVDFQLLRYCPPGHDILALLYLNTTREMRIKCEDKVIEEYYKELSKIIESYGFKIDDVLPYQDLIGGINLMKPSMLMQAAIYSNLSMCTPDQISALFASKEQVQKVFFEDRREFLEKMCAASPTYKSRLKDRVQDIYDYLEFMNQP